MSSSNTSTVASASRFIPLTQPSESADGYFPNGATASNTTTTPLTGASTPLDDTPSTGNGSNSHPLSPLDRSYTKPVGDELDIAEQLEKQPTYWSARGWVQRSVTATTSGATTAAQDAAARARKFEETKKDLLASVGRF